MSFNQLSGPLPSLPTKMTLLDIASNQISGVLPNDMSGWTNMLEMDIDDNMIDGNMPTQLPPNIHVFSTRYNKLGGSLAALPKTLRVLDVGGNFIGGSIPDAPAGSELNWVRCNYQLQHTLAAAADVADQTLVAGPPSSAMPNKHSQLEFHYFGRQCLGLCARPCFQGKCSGSIPELIAFNEAMSLCNPSGHASSSHTAEDYIWSIDGPVCVPFLQVDISSNSFEGGLPQRLMNLGNLMYLNASFNQLTSFGDAKTWKLPALLTLDVSSNLIEGKHWLTDESAPFWV